MIILHICIMLVVTRALAFILRPTCRHFSSLLSSPAFLRHLQVHNSCAFLLLSHPQVSHRCLPLYDPLRRLRFALRSPRVQDLPPLRLLLRRLRLRLHRPRLDPLHQLRACPRMRESIPKWYLFGWVVLFHHFRALLRGGIQPLGRSVGHRSGTRVADEVGIRPAGDKNSPFFVACNSAHYCSLQSACCSLISSASELQLACYEYLSYDSLGKVVGWSQEELSCGTS
ncbi:hypothetical protein Cni_G06220 [Canna indica]|uniref:Secreted protein n=1 Tax=Canna indica TaxID=4628 RepID=A0AAQ3JWL8_9LILI|nr:hypothetical protein Cni_G06220 [Canna indica]